MDARWRAIPGVLLAGPDRDQLLAPLLACAGGIAGPGTPSHIYDVGALAEEIALAAGWDPVLASDLRIHGACSV